MSWNSIERRERLAYDWGLEDDPMAAIRAAYLRGLEDARLARLRHALEVIAEVAREVLR